MSDSCSDEHPEQQHRQRTDIASAKEPVIAIAKDRHGLGAAHPHGNALGHTHHGKRGEKGWNSDARADDAIDHTDNETCCNACKNGQGDTTDIHRHGCGHRGKARHSADGKINFTSRQDISHRNRHDRDGCGLAHYVEEIVGIKKSLVAQGYRKENEDPHKPDIDDVLAPVGKPKARGH
jgi:hypothetical protein